MEAVLEKDIKSETIKNIIDKKLLEVKELEAKGGQYYTQDEMNIFLRNMKMYNYKNKYLTRCKCKLMPLFLLRKICLKTKVVIGGGLKNSVYHNTKNMVYSTLLSLISMKS